MGDIDKKHIRKKIIMGKHEVKDAFKIYWKIILLIIVPLSIIGIFFNFYFSNDIQIILTVIGVTTAIEALIITTFFQNKTNQTEGLLRAFSKLNGIDHRKMRTCMYKTFVKRTGEFSLYPNFSFVDKYLINILDGETEISVKLNDGQSVQFEDAVKQIRTDYDEIGALMKYNLIPKNAFLDVYWGNVIRSWCVLYGNTKKHQDEVLTSYFMSNFKYLYEESMKFWKEREPNRTINFYENK